MPFGVSLENESLLQCSFEKILGTTSTQGRDPLNDTANLNTMIDQLNQQPTYGNETEGPIKILMEP